MTLGPVEIEVERTISIQIYLTCSYVSLKYNCISSFLNFSRHGGLVSLEYSLPQNDVLSDLHAIHDHWVRSAKRFKATKVTSASGEANIIAPYVSDTLSFDVCHYIPLAVLLS